MKASWPVFTLIFAFAALPPASLHGREADHERARHALDRGEIHSLSEVLASVSRQVPGEIIEVKLHRHKKEGWVYEFKVLDAAGVLKKVEVDAATKEILKIKDKPERPHAPPPR